MRVGPIRQAIAEARRFIVEAEALLAQSKADQAAYAAGRQEKPRPLGDDDGASAGLRSGATRRASLDLTRALARMRKP